MASLDYAFIADFARVEKTQGTLTAVGASWTFLQASVLPTTHRMAVAGRIRAQLGEGPIALRIDVRGPEDMFRLAAEAELGPETNARPYGEGRVGHMFALDLEVPIPRAGTYGIYIDVDGEQARRLAFEVLQVHEDA